MGAASNLSMLSRSQYSSTWPEDVDMYLFILLICSETKDAGPRTVLQSCSPRGVGV